MRMTPALVPQKCFGDLPICDHHLIALGFTVDHSPGHPIFRRVIPGDDETTSCVTALHLLEDESGAWIVELANQLTPDDPPTLVAFPRLINSHDELHALWRVITGEELFVSEESDVPR